MKKDIKTHSRNEGKPSVCRLCSLKNFGGVLLGRDIAGVFTDGHVYDIRVVLGEIMIRDLGPHAAPAYLGTNGTINQYATSGVVMLTEEEYRRQLALEKN